jgi:hypothetical protein
MSKSQSRILNDAHVGFDHIGNINAYCYTNGVSTTNESTLATWSPT